MTSFSSRALRSLVPALSVCLLLSQPALAQRSEPLPYSDDEPKTTTPAPSATPPARPDEAGDAELKPPPRRKKVTKPEPVPQPARTRKESSKRRKKVRGDEPPLPDDLESHRPVLGDPDSDGDAEGEASQTLREETERDFEPETQKKIPRLFREDDPYLGIGAELMAGLMLLDRTRGGVEAKVGLGVRAVWEFGRMFEDERVQDHLFADLTWLTAASSGGTDAIHSTTRIHDFTLAPAYMFRLDERGLFGAYLQLGGGISYSTSTLHYGDSRVRTGAISPLFQYGGGFRFRLGLSESGQARITGRVELTRFRRAYMDDTYFGVGLGATF